MIAKLRKILGLETNEEKLNRFHETNNSIACLSKKIDDLAEEFTVKNESFKSLLKSNNFDDQIKKNIQLRYNNFIDYHKKELQPIIKERRELRKQHEQLLKDSSLFKAIREINIIGNAKDKYVNGEINREGYDLILKATQGKVSYSDIIIFNEEGKILLLQRSNEEGDKLSNMWGVPGGHVDLGEEFIDAAKRELWEESGITCNDLEEIGVFTDNKVEIHYFKGIINSKEVVPVVQSSEVQDVKWISIDEIGEHKMPFNMAENLFKFIKQDSGVGYWEKLETAVKQGKIEKSFYDELFLKANHKYIKKEQDGKGGWKYIYKESKEIPSKLEKSIKKVSKKISKLGEEHLYGFTEEGENIFHTNSGKENEVKIPKEVEAKLKGNHLLHNHPKSNCFSINDIHVCLVNQTKTTMVAVSNSKFGEGIYFLENNLSKKIDLNEHLEEINSELDKWYNNNDSNDKLKNETIWVDIFKQLEVYKKNSKNINIYFKDVNGNKTQL